MTHFNLGDRHALFAGDRGNEPVHLPIELQRLDDVGVKGLQRAAVIVQPDAVGPRDQPVRDHRRQQPREEGVLPVSSPAAHDVVARFELRDHPWDVMRIVLQIAV